jgi:prepilin-type N-terminal cleavage/methylation domain-containing protein
MNRALTSPPCRGFTIVELMIAMLAGSILALTAGIVLFQGFTVLTRNRAAAELQRDGSIAVEMLQRKLRESTRSDIRLVTGGIEIDLPGGKTASLTDNGAGDLVYDPDTGSGGGLVTIIDGTLVAMTAELSNTLARIELNLSNGEEGTDLDAVIHFRN